MGSAAVGDHQQRKVFPEEAVVKQAQPPGPGLLGTVRGPTMTMMRCAVREERKVPQAIEVMDGFYEKVAS